MKVGAEMYLQRIDISASLCYLIFEVIKMQDRINVATAPKSGTFQMRMNPKVRQEVEAIYANYGLTLTDAINIFIQQSLNAEGLPFLLSPENAEYMRAKSVARLMAEIQKGWDSVKSEADWVNDTEAYRLLGADE